MDSIGLGKILQSQGFGSRKECRALVSLGEVTVGGETVRDYEREFRVDGFEFAVRGETWKYREHVYVALDKPPGYECSRRPSHHPGILELFPPQFDLRDVQPVGRLDFDTTGLLLLSDDGDFIHAQSSPKRHVPKRYVAETADPVTSALVSSLMSGVQLHDEPAPLRAVSCEALGERELAIVLEQGKYHQVKRMLAAAGNRCVALKRISIGSLTLESLGIKEGEWLHLSDDQLSLLRSP